MTDNQERENFYHRSYVHKGFISANNLLNDLMKILVNLVYSIMLFLKSDCYCKNICWFKYELRSYYDFTLRNIAISQYHIWRKQIKKLLSSKNQVFLYRKKTVVNQEKFWSFSNSAPSN